MLRAVTLFRAFAVVSSPHARPTRRRPTAFARWAPFGRSPRASASMSTAAEEDPALTARKNDASGGQAALKALTSEEMASQSAAIATHLLAQLSCFDLDAARTRAATDRPLRLGLYVHCARLRGGHLRALAAALAPPREVRARRGRADPAAGRRAPRPCVSRRSARWRTWRRGPWASPSPRIGHRTARPAQPRDARDGRPAGRAAHAGPGVRARARGSGAAAGSTTRFSSAARATKRVAEVARGGTRFDAQVLAAGQVPGKRGPKRTRS